MMLPPESRPVTVIWYGPVSKLPSETPWLAAAQVYWLGVSTWPTTSIWMVSTPAASQNWLPNVQSTSTGTHWRVGPQAAAAAAKAARKSKRRIGVSLSSETTG